MNDGSWRWRAPLVFALALAIFDAGDLTHAAGAMGGRARPPVAQAAAASRNDDAGEAAWRRLTKGEPSEWEGDVESEAQWRIQGYGGFLERFPRHQRSGEALFKVAEATWARSGYPEAFHYIFTFDGWDAWKKKATYLEQWFDTSGFGGGKIVGPDQDRKQAAAARDLFLQVLREYATSPSAPMAQYYAAVILDYCLDLRPQAVKEYEAFIRLRPDQTVWVGKARKRVVALTR
jgi:hypothetical protein